MGEFQRASTGLSTNDEAKKSANAIFQVCSSYDKTTKSRGRSAMFNAKSFWSSVAVSMLCTSQVLHSCMHVRMIKSALATACQ